MALATNRRKLVAAAKALFLQWHATLPPDRGPVSAYCVMHSFFMASVLRSVGYATAQLNAGSAYWPRVKEADFDSAEHPQFGYSYEPGQHNVERIKQGLLPEMHCWCALVEPRPTIIDITTSYFPEQCRLTANLPWDGPTPPEYVWHEVLEPFPLRGVVYEPQIEATAIALAAVRHMLKQFPCFPGGTP
jgi:hypothetical protein